MQLGDALRRVESLFKPYSKHMFCKAFQSIGVLKPKAHFFPWAAMTLSFPKCLEFQISLERYGLIGPDDTDSAFDSKNNS